MTNGNENTTGTDMVLVPRALLLQAQDALRGCAGPDEIRNAQRDLGETIRRGKIEMTKQIVYLVTDNGIDGRAPTSVLNAAFSEAERDAMIEADASKAWRGKDEKIIDLKIARVQALAKLDGIDRLVLGLSPWPSRE